MKDHVKQIMAKTFNIPISDIADNAEISDLASWDSLSHMILMLELEAEFDVSIPTEKMTTLISLDLIDAFLQERGVQAGNEDPESLVEK
jgi:acyl carrier protein